jgi:hypothetical protein
MIMRKALKWKDNTIDLKDTIKKEAKAMQREMI